MSARPRRASPGIGSAKSAEGDLVESIPEGYEIYENPDAQVFLRKIVPQLVTPAEVAVVEEGLKRYAPGQNCLVDVQGEQIVVYHAERVSLDLEGFGFGLTELPTFNRRYMKVMRFTLVDEKDRTLPGPAVVLPGLDRPLDRPLGVRRRREALRSGQEILPAHRTGVVLRVDVG